MRQKEIGRHKTEKVCKILTVFVWPLQVQGKLIAGPSVIRKPPRSCWEATRSNPWEEFWPRSFSGLQGPCTLESKVAGEICAVFKVGLEYYLAAGLAWHGCCNSHPINHTGISPDLLKFECTWLGTRWRFKKGPHHPSGCKVDGDHGHAMTCLSLLTPHGLWAFISVVLHAKETAHTRSGR